MYLHVVNNHISVEQINNLLKIQYYIHIVNTICLNKQQIRSKMLYPVRCTFKLLEFAVNKFFVDFVGLLSHELKSQISVWNFFYHFSVFQIFFCFKVCAFNKSSIEKTGPHAQKVCAGGGGGGMAGRGMRLIYFNMRKGLIKFRTKPCCWSRGDAHKSSWI